MTNVVNGAARVPEGGTAAERPDARPVDFAYLAWQTFGDEALERELLSLFVAQMRASLPELPTLAPDAQDGLIHKLKGSCQAIGAGEAAQACRALELSAPAVRGQAHARLLAAFAAAEAAIGAHLASRFS